ncbi:MAG: rhodanese-like domain-containing protein [Halothece sp.]
MLERIFPSPSFKSRSRAYDLKARLDWGAPALTIIDIRDRTEFHHSHILGAISMPLQELLGWALTTLDLDRDIYVYGDTDEETAIAASQLLQAGFQSVSQLQGGLAAWKAFGYPVESGRVIVGN